MTRIVFFCLLILVALTYYLCEAAEEMTVEALIQGVNQARLTIQSGEVQIIITVEPPAEMSEDELAAWIKNTREDKLKNFTPGPLYPNLEQYERKVIAPELKAGAYWLGKRTEVEHINTAFQIIEPDASADPTLYQYKLTLMESPNYTIDSDVPLTPGKLYVLVYDTETQVKQTIGDIIFSDSQSAFFNSDNMHYGYWHFSLFGRSRFRLPANTKRIGKETIDGTECHILSIEDENKRKVRIWVDPTKDFCVRKIERHRTSAKKHILSRRVYKQFQKFGDTWFPKITEDTVYEEDGTAEWRYVIEVSAAEFNVDFPKDFFKINRSYYGSSDNRQGMGLLPDSDTSPIESDPGFLLCGPKSLSRICELLKVKTTLIELQKLSGYTRYRGTTMLGLKAAATYKGLAPIGIRASVELLRRKKVPLPAIAYVNNNHFLVFENVDKEGVKTSDPARKYEPHLTWDELTAIWRGKLLIFDKNKARSAKQKQTPLAFTDAPEYDFGKVIGGSKIKHTFTIKNIGQKPLKIISVKETCACTASVISQNKILPGKTGDISAVLTVPSGNKRVWESLHVFTDDPVHNTLTLTLKGEVFTPLSTFPTRLVFGHQGPPQKPLTKQVSLHIEEGVQIRSVRTDSEHLTATLKTKDGIPHVEVQLLPTIPAGQFSYYLLVDYTYKEKQASHKVFAFGQVLGELKVAPNRLFLGLIKDLSAVSKTITVSSRNTKPFQITSVESGTKAVKVTVKEMDSKTDYQITMTLSPKAESGELSGDVIIHTSSSVQPTVRVPFFGIIADAK